MTTCKHLLLLLIALVSCGTLTAQKDSDVLFSVADQPVTVGEFRYIYQKTNGEAADFSEESVKEYLDLYQRFKLKVARARTMGLDTIQSLQQELAGYRRQLANNYLEEQLIVDRLVEDLYTRMQEDIDFSHILLRFEGNPDQRAAAAVEARATALKQELTLANFAEKARTHSDDTFSKERGGRIGFVTPLFPKGLHQLEAALYAAADNTIVGPVRSPAGYHLLLRHRTRPARGEMEAAHIVVRKKEGSTVTGIPDKIRQAQKALAAGGTFEAVARKFSEDKKTASAGGYLGFFGINRYDTAFETAAFGLTEDGQVSDIVETAAGFHLIQRISRKEIQPLRDLRPLLEQKVKADGRYADARKEMLVELRDKYSVTVDQGRFGRYAALLEDSTFLDFRWAPAPVREKGPVITFGDGTSVGLSALQEYFRKNNRKRVSLGKRSNAFTVADQLFDEWVDEQVIAYAEERLEQDFPDFAALMREYREGILLFEATKLEVWDKANEDTLGLQQFFADHRQNYLFEERLTATFYTVEVSPEVNPAAVKDVAANHDRQATLGAFPKGVTAQEETLDKSTLQKIGLTNPQAGATTPLQNNLNEGTATFYKIEALLPARPKELSEARGYVIADYQDQLEREWVKRLRQQYPIEVNRKILKKLIKS